MVKLELYRVFREVAEAGNISLAESGIYFVSVLQITDCFICHHDLVIIFK